MTIKKILGKSGIRYEFGIFKLDGELPEKPGVFFLVKEHQPIRSGVTENLREEVVKLRKKRDVKNSLIYFHLRYNKTHCSLIVQDVLESNESQEMNRGKKAQFAF